MAKRARTERREAERTAVKLAKSSEKLARLEPGGAPDRPIGVATASVIESQARSLACVRCGAEGSARVASHEARVIDGARLRVVRVACPVCGSERDVYFGIVAPS